MCNLGGRLIAQIIIARLLGPDGTGRIAYLVWLIEIANLLICFGLPSSLTRYLAELHGQRKGAQASRFAQWVFVRYLILAILGSAVVGVFFVFSSQYVDSKSVLPLLMVLFLVRGLELINQADLTGRQQFDRLARVNIAAAVVLVIGVAAGTFWFGLTGVLYGYIAGALIPAVYSFTILRGFAFRWQMAADLHRRVWKFSFHIWLAMLASTFVWSRMEIFFLERYWDVHEVAMFTVGLTFTVMIYQVAMMFSGAFMAHFAHLVGGDGHDVIRRQYQTATRLMALAIVPMAFGGAGIMPALLPLLFGADFAPAVPVAMVLTATSALAFSLIGSNLVYAKERSGFIAISGFAGAILSVAAGVWIVSRFGVWGAAWSRLFVQGSVVVATTWFIVRRLHCPCPLVALGRTAVAAGLCGLAAWCVIRLVPHPISALALAVPTGIAVYALGVKFLRVLGPEEMRQLKRVAGRLPVTIHRPFAVALDAMGGMP